MIYDGHAYCFEDQRGKLGWADRAQMTRHRQLSVAGHAQAAVVGSALIDVINSAPPHARLERAAQFIAELAGLARSTGRS